MFKQLNEKTWADGGILVLRLFFGLTMVFAHGLPKLSGFTDKMDSFPDPIGLGSPVALGLAVFAEFFCGLAVAIGLFTRLTLIPLIITMIVAAFIIHGEDPFNKMELALCYLAAYVGIFCTGPGKYSVDAKMS